MKSVRRGGEQGDGDGKVGDLGRWDREMGSNLWSNEVRWGRKQDQYRTNCINATLASEFREKMRATTGIWCPWTLSRRHEKVSGILLPQ